MKLLLFLSVLTLVSCNTAVEKTMDTEKSEGFFVTPTPTPKPIPTPVPTPVPGPKTDHFTYSNIARDLEILWVIDNSGSMADEQDDLSDNFQSFINQFITKNVPFRMAITTTDPGEYGAGTQGTIVPNSDTKLTSVAMAQNQARFISDFQSMIKVGISGSSMSGKESGLYAVQGFFSKYTAKVDRHSFMAIVIVSDEDDSSPSTAETYINLFKSYKNSPGLIKIYTICDITRSNQQPGLSVGCDKDSEASRLTSGVVSDIRGSFADSLANMGDNLTNLMDAYPLSAVPLPGTLRVFVNGIETNEFTYDSVSNTIKINDTFVMSNGTSISAQYSSL